jgi:hypothetical protein
MVKVQRNMRIHQGRRVSQLSSPNAMQPTNTAVPYNVMIQESGSSEILVSVDVPARIICT